MTKKEQAEPVELSPSARLQNITQMQQALQDAMAAAKKAEQDYEAAVQAEQQNLLKQIEDFRVLVGGNVKVEIPTATIGFIQPVEPISQPETPANTTFSTPVTYAEPLATPLPMATPASSTTTSLLSTSLKDKLISAFWAIIIALAIVGTMLAIMMKWSASPDGGGGGGNAKQMQIINAVVAETSLNQNEKYVMAAQRLYQEYYAEHGTGTEEEKREAARTFALKYFPPDPQNASDKAELEARIKAMQEEMESLKKKQPPPDHSTRRRILHDTGDGDVVPNTEPEPSIVDPVPQQEDPPKQPNKTAPRLFRQRADGTYEQLDNQTAWAMISGMAI